MECGDDAVRGLTAEAVNFIYIYIYVHIYIYIHEYMNITVGLNSENVLS